MQLGTMLGSMSVVAHSKSLLFHTARVCCDTQQECVVTHSKQVCWAACPFYNTAGDGVRQQLLLQY